MSASQKKQGISLRESLRDSFKVTQIKFSTICWCECRMPWWIVVQSTRWKNDILLIFSSNNSPGKKCWRWVCLSGIGSRLAGLLCQFKSCYQLLTANAIVKIASRPRTYPRSTASVVCLSLGPRLTSADSFISYMYCTTACTRAKTSDKVFMKLCKVSSCSEWLQRYVISRRG